MKKIYLLILIIFTLGFIQCTVEYDNILVEGCNPKDTICEVTIGSQIWMCKNLDVDHYRNGDSIPEVRDPLEWAILKSGAWCYYNNDPEMGLIYGKLYNWYAVNDPRGLAPEGWHIASDEEWATLINFIGGDSTAGGKLKETGITHWQSPNAGATNETGYNALPGGWRFDRNGAFMIIGDFGGWWTTTSWNPSGGIAWVVNSQSPQINRWAYALELGLSVRCVKD